MFLPAANMISHLFSLSEAVTGFDSDSNQCTFSQSLWISPHGPLVVCSVCWKKECVCRHTWDCKWETNKSDADRAHQQQFELCAQRGRKRRRGRWGKGGSWDRDITSGEMTEGRRPEEWKLNKNFYNETRAKRPLHTRHVFFTWFIYTLLIFLGHVSSQWKFSHQRWNSADQYCIFLLFSDQGRFWHLTKSECVLFTTSHSTWRITITTITTRTMISKTTLGEE